MRRHLSLTLCVAIGLACFLTLLPVRSADNETLESPRIDYVVPAKEQPEKRAEATIWYDDFNGPPKSYAEGGKSLDESQSYGGEGRSLKLHYEKGQQGTGGAKVFFGDTPIYSNKAPRAGETFDDIYWRIYVKHQPGWQGAPAKMSRATSMASSRWSQAMIAHVWSGAGDSLTLDPVRAVENGQVTTRRYNDFEKMRWLGNRPSSQFPIHATEESGYWVLVESRAKLNTPGKKDGLNQLWIDGRLACERRNLDFRGTYTGHGINAVFLEAYWNDGSPVTQSRWFDNFVIATEPIGPVTCPANPTIVKAAIRNGQADKWEVDVAADSEGKEVVFRSKPLKADRPAEVNSDTGTFSGRLDGKDRLDPRTTYYLRARHLNDSGTHSAWSHWHQPFRVE